MRVNHLNFMPMSARMSMVEVSKFDALLSSGRAVEVTGLARNSFPAGRVAIDASVFEQHVAWPNSAMRNHMIYLDEAIRLDAILQAASVALRHESPAEFTHRAIACEANTSNPERHTFVLQRVEDSASTGWLIRQ